MKISRSRKARLTNKNLEGKGGQTIETKEKNIFSGSMANSVIALHI